MAIIKGAINFGSNFNIGAKGPIDARQRVETIEDLTTVWTAEIPAYKGMVVSVLEDNSIYILKADDATVFDNWKKVGDVTGDITNLQGQITANKTAIDKINGDANTTGSFKKGDADTLAAAKQYTDNAKTDLIGDDATADTIKHAEKLATDASDKVDTEIGKLNSTVNNEAASAGDAASTQIKVTVEEAKGKLTRVTVNAPSFESAGAADAVKSELLGTDTDTSDSNTIKGAKKYTDASIAALDAVGNISEAVKGVTVTVDETDGKVIKPVVSIADGTLTGAATDGNLVTGTAVKTYVDGEITKVNTAAGELGTRVTTLEGKHAEGKTVAQEVKEGIAGIAETSKANTAGSDVVVTVTTKSGSVSSVAVDSSVLKKAVTDGDASVKSDLIDNATGDYNTLGKLEGKIKAADAKAVAAQQTADAKVKSVEGTNTVVATTTDHAVSVSLKTSNKGNVKFTQDTDGLSANVTIPEATVTGVKADDKFLSLADKLVSADVSIAYDATDKKIYLYGKDKNKANAVSSIDCRDFIKDGMLNSAELVTNPAGQSAGTYIKLTWNTDSGKKDPMYINVTSLIDVYTAGNGLSLSGHEFSVDTGVIATVESVNGVASRVSTLEGKVATIEGEGEGSIKKAVADEASRAKAAEKANADAIVAEVDRATKAEQANSDAIAAETTRATAAEEKVKTDLIGNADTDTKDSDTIKGAKKYTDALETKLTNAAVTLTIPENDPYITASKEGDTNKYTIKSKLDTDGKTPLVDVKIDDKLTKKIDFLVGGGTSTAVNGISVTVTETAGKISKPEVSVTPGKVAADNASVVTGGAVYTAVEAAKSALLGTDGDAATKDTIKGAKKYTDTSIAALDVTGNTSDAVKGVTVTVNETDGKVIKPVVSIADGTIGGVSDTNLVTGDTVKTYVDTAITNAALVWHDIA